MEELKDRYEIIEEAASDAIVTIDEQGRILSISRAAERIFGHTVPEMTGQSVDAIIPNYKQHVEQVRRRGKSAPVIEVTGIHKTGKPVQIELSLGEYNKNNRHIYTAVIRDIGAAKGHRPPSGGAVRSDARACRIVQPVGGHPEAAAVHLRGGRLGARRTVGRQRRSNTLHVEGSWHVPTYEVEEFEKAGRKTILFPGIDLVGRVLSSGQPAWIDNVVDDKNFPRAPIAERVGLHGAFAFPIRVGEHVACVMAFYNREVVQPDDEMLQMFDALGRQVGDFIKTNASRGRARQAAHL